MALSYFNANLHRLGSMFSKVLRHNLVIALIWCHTQRSQARRTRRGGSLCSHQASSHMNECQQQPWGQWLLKGAWRCYCNCLTGRSLSQRKQSICLWLPRTRLTRRHVIRGALTRPVCLLLSIQPHPLALPNSHVGVYGCLCPSGNYCFMAGFCDESLHLASFISYMNVFLGFLCPVPASKRHLLMSLSVHQSLIICVCFFPDCFFVPALCIEDLSHRCHLCHAFL